MSTLFRRSDDAIFAAVGNDIVALHIPKGRCYGMEEVTAAVWQILENPRDLDSICAALADQYDVDPAVCRTEVGQLMRLLKSEGLVDSEGGVAT